MPLDRPTGAARLSTAALAAFCLASGGCGRTATAPDRSAAPPAASASPAPAPRPEPPSGPPLVVFLGDSLTAGLGLPEGEAYPSLVAAALAAKGKPVRVVNAGISGDTTSGGLRRLDWLLSQRPAVLVVALGANDGLRGVPVETTEASLREIVTRAKGSGARVLLCGMLVPPNYGPDYTGRFEELFPKLAKELGVPLLPFLLDSVAGVDSLNQADGIHPNAEGQRRVAATVLPRVEELLP